MRAAIRFRLLLKANTCRYLFNEIDAGLQVHAKVDEFPLDAFFLVFLLFQHEHMVVEELLESLVGVVDTQLLEAVELEVRNVSIKLLRPELLYKAP